MLCNFVSKKILVHVIWGGSDKTKASGRILFQKCWFCLYMFRAYSYPNYVFTSVVTPSTVFSSNKPFFHNPPHCLSPTRWTLPWFTLCAASWLVSWPSPTPASTPLPFTCWARLSRSSSTSSCAAAVVLSSTAPHRARLIIPHVWPLSVAHITPWRVWAS